MKIKNKIKQNKICLIKNHKKLTKMRSKNKNKFNQKHQMK